MKLLQLAITILVAIAMILIPLDGFYLRWISQTPTAIIVISQIPDLLLFIAFATMVLAFSKSRRRFNIIGYNTELFMGSFIILAIVSTLLNTASLFQTVIALKSIFRYVLVVYIIINMDFDKRMSRRLIKVFQVILGLELVIGFSQMFLGIEAKKHFLPPSSSEIGSQFNPTSLTHLLKEDVIFGTMDKSIEFSLLMLVGFAFVVNQGHRLTFKKFLISLIIFVLIFESGSRSAVVAAVLVVAVSYVVKNGMSRFMVRVILFGPILLGFLVWILSNMDFKGSTFLFAFTQEYVDIAQRQRLGTVTILLPAFFSSGWHLLLGFSPDIDVINDFLKLLPKLPMLVEKQPGTIQDVYWVALLYQYGFLGLIIFVLFLLSIFKKVSGIKTFVGRLNITATVVSLIITSVFLNAFNQAYEIRTFSFFLWFFVGLALSQIRSQLNSYNPSSRP